MSRTAPRLLAAAALAAASLGVASTAQAAITVTSPTGSPSTLTVSLDRSGVSPSATAYTLAQCNIAGSPGSWGRDCNLASATSFTAIPGTSWTDSITVDGSFSNTSFVPGFSPTRGSSTTCTNHSPILPDPSDPNEVAE